MVISLKAAARSHTAAAAALLLSVFPLAAQSDAGKLDQARQSYESTLAADPANRQAQAGEVSVSEQIALEQRAGGHMVEALQALLQGEKFVPDNPRLFYDQGILEDEMRLYPEALKALERARQLHMDSPRLTYAMARVLFDQGQLAPAAQKMQEYLKAQPDDATAHYGLGRIYQLGMQFDQARAQFEDSVRLQPKQTEGYFQLGDVALKQQQYDEALRQFAKTLARDPKHGGALAGSGEALYHQKKYAQALDFLQRAVAAAPDYQTGHYYLGLTLARLGHKQQADRELATATKLADADNKKSSTHYQLVVPK